MKIHVTLSEFISDCLRVREHISERRVGNDALTCSICIKASCVEYARVELQADDGEYDNGEENEQRDLEQGSHGFQDRFQHHLKT